MPERGHDFDNLPKSFLSMMGLRVHKGSTALASAGKGSELEIGLGVGYLDGQGDLVSR